jgi:hypothetical protein
MKREKREEHNLAAKVSQWAKSSEGQKKIQEILKRSQEAARSFDDACRVDPKVLNMPLNL